MGDIAATPIDAGSLPLMSMSQYQTTWANYFYGQSSFYSPRPASDSNMGGLTDPFSGLSVAVMGAGGNSSGTSIWSVVEWGLIALVAIAVLHFVENA
jgi:hypothetical protein